MTIKRSARLVLAALFVAAIPATQAFAACVDCGTVVDVRTVTQKGESSGAGAVQAALASPGLRRARRDRRRRPAHRHHGLLVELGEAEIAAVVLAFEIGDASARVAIALHQLDQ